MNPGPPDTVAPVLTGLTIDGATSAFSVFSDEAGILHWVLDGIPTYADAASLAAAMPGGAASGLRMAAGGVIAEAIDLTGVADGNWNLHVGIIDAAGNASNVLSGIFSVNSGLLELNSDPLEWNGDQLVFNAA